MSLATEEFSGLLQHNPRKFEKMRQKLCWFGICTHTPENLDCLHIWSVMDIHAETEGIYAKKILHRFPRQSMHANKQCFRLHLQIPTSQGNLAIVHTLHGIYAGNPTNIDNRNFTEFSSLYWFSTHVLWKKSCLDQYVSVSPSQVKEFLSSYQRKRVTFELEIPLRHFLPNVYRIIPKLFSKARSLQMCCWLNTIKPHIEMEKKWKYCYQENNALA